MNKQKPTDYTYYRARNESDPSTGTKKPEVNRELGNKIVETDDHWGIYL